MHLGNGVVTTECAAVGLGAATAGAGVGLTLVRAAPRPDPLRFAAACALVFALQMFNVPVFAGASGHVIGGFLLAYWFGAAWALFGMAALLAVQTLLFADGGLLALGLNVTTMAVVPCLIVYPLWRRWAGKLTGAARWGSVAAGAWTSVVLASLVCGAALFSRPEVRAQAGEWLWMMLGVHMIIGLVEAAVTVAALTAVQAMRSAGQPARQLAAGTGILALAVAAFYGASPWPDGLEFSLERLGVGAMEEGLAGQLAAWQHTVAPWPEYGLLLGALAGCALVGALAWVMSRSGRART